jgi:DNA-3-methyladenine glycosylase I
MQVNGGTMIDLQKIRCRWCGSDPLLIRYHDEEWGKYARDDQEYQYFEKMALEIFQAGLSWRTILHKRENFREAFDKFDVDTIARYDDRKITQLLGNQGIVRNRMKIEAVIYNAREIIRLRQQDGSFAKYLAQLNVNNVTDVYKEFKKRFRFMGPTVTESFLQTVGKMPVTHEPQCWLYKAED